MNRKIIFLFRILIIIVLFSSCAKNSIIKSEKSLNCLFLDNNYLLLGMNNPKVYSNHNEKIIAGVVPHHLVAAQMSAGFLKLASSSDYDLIAILAPNHYSPNKAIITSYLDWSINKGKVFTDVDSLKQIMDVSAISTEIDDNIMENDHSVSNLIPFIGHYFPKAKVASFLLSNSIDMENTKKFVLAIKEVSKSKKVLLLCSIDFSHFLTPSEATKRDSVTKEAILNFDYSRINSFNNQYIDCPSALTAYLYYTELNVAKINVLDNSDASKFTNELNNGTTSYFILSSNK